VVQHGTTEVCRAFDSGRRHRSSGDVLDDLDQLVDAVTVAACEVDELSCSLDDGADRCVQPGPARPSGAETDAISRRAQDIVVEA
jgi:hypothetical protein